MSAQLELRPTDWRAVWGAWRAVLRAVVDALGPKQVCWDLNVKSSVLLDALAGRDRHHVYADWIPYLIAKAPNDDALAYLAALRGRAIVEPAPVSPAEELADLKAQIHETLGAELAKALTSKAARRRPSIFDAADAERDVKPANARKKGAR